MPRKLVKAGGFATFLPPDVAPTEADFTKLEAAARVKFNPDARNRIETTINTYKEDVAYWAAAPSPADVVPVLSRIAKQVAELDDSLHRLNAAPSTALQAARSSIAAQARPMDLRELHAAVGLLRFAASRAEGSFIASSDGQKRGPKGEPARVRLVATIEGVFRDAGGTGTITYTGGQSSGPLYDLVRAVLHLAGATDTPDGTRGRLGKQRKGKRSIHAIPLKARELKD
jgi:hypothetical protein